MNCFKRLFVKAVLLAPGIALILSSNLILCPPLESNLTPTLLDVFLYPGLTGQ